MAPSRGWLTGAGCGRGISAAVRVGLSRGLLGGPHNVVAESERGRGCGVFWGPVTSQPPPGHTVWEGTTRERGHRELVPTLPDKSL